MALTPEQLEKRKRGIGSSEAPAVCGLDPFDGPFAVWLEKTGQSAEETPNEDEEVSIKFTDIGDALEEPIAQMAMRKLRVTEVRQGTTVAHPVEEWALATPDRLLPQLEDSILECKNVGRNMIHFWDPDASDDRGVPAHYLAQVQWQLHVLDAPRAYVSALLGGRDHRLFTIERDRSVGERMFVICREFWFENVMGGIKPPMDASSSSKEWLRQRFPRSQERTLTADWRMEELAAEMRTLRRRLSEDEKAEAALSHEMQSWMGDAAAVKFADGTVLTWRTRESGNVKWKSVAETLGATEELANQHRGAAPRVFTPPRKWSK